MEAANTAERTRLLKGFRLAEGVVRPEDGSLSLPVGTTRLEPLLMELLVFLCSRAGQVVPKQALLDAVWGGRFVSDETVKGSLYQLRKALGDDPRRPRFIETLPKRGYRMLVQPVPLDSEPPSGSPASEARELVRKGRAALSGALQEHEATLGQKNQDDLLILHSLLDEKDRCFELLERAFQEGNPSLLWLPASPLFDNLRADLCSPEPRGRRWASPISGLRRPFHGRSS